MFSYKKVCQKKGEERKEKKNSERKLQDQVMSSASLLKVFVLS